MGALRNYFLPEFPQPHQLDCHFQPSDAGRDSAHRRCSSQGDPEAAGGQWSQGLYRCVRRGKGSSWCCWLLARLR